MLKVQQNSFGRKRTIFKRSARTKFRPAYANDTSAFNPTHWAAEGVEVLYDKLVFPGLIDTDFNDDVAEFGDTVKTRKVSKMTGRRKQDDLDTIQMQDARATPIEVKLNQRVYSSFILGDFARSVSFQDLISTFLVPCVESVAEMTDRTIASQAVRFLGNSSGGLGTLSVANSHDYLLDAREDFNLRNVPEDGRVMAFATKTDTVMQKNTLFKNRDFTGEGGVGLRKAFLGELAGWQNFYSNNTMSVRNGTKATATTLTAAGSAGDTTINVAAAPTVGAYVTVDGDMSPLRVTVSGLASTVNRPLRNNVANGAGVTVYETGLINQPAAVAATETLLAVTNGYPAGYSKEMYYDGAATVRKGQLISFTDSAGTIIPHEYGVIMTGSDAGGNWFMVDRPLEAAMDDNAVVCIGPDGDYNLAMTRGAIMMVNRPLELPPEGLGSRAGAFNAHNLSLRVEMSRQANTTQGTVVTVDILFGLAVRNEEMGGVLLA